MLQYPLVSCLYREMILFSKEAFSLEISFLGILARNLLGVKIVDGGLYFIFPFHFYFTLLYFSFNFLFLEQLGLGVISHAVTSVTT